VVPAFRPTVRPAGLLRFSHAKHFNYADSAARACATCHSARNASRMDVSLPEPATCTGCHAHATTGHLANDNKCATCHVTLAVARELTVDRIAAFPKPPAHDSAGFAERHGQVAVAAGANCAFCHARESCARCHVNAALVPQIEALGRDARVATLVAAKAATYPMPTDHSNESFGVAHGALAQRNVARCANCHARESCARCHVNAALVPQIAALGRDARVAALVAGKAATYPVPADHRDPSFRFAHGAAAQRDILRCGSCHARSSCTTCHIGTTGNAALRGMPNVEPGGARGVELIDRPARPRLNPPTPALMLAAAALTDSVPRTALAPARTVRVHDLGFRTGHGAQASAATLNCAGCHERRFCADCHTGEGRRRFHPANFEARHAADAYGRETECSSCHNAELFCRACHRESGLASRGRLDVAFHSAQPQWLLQHGRAARQGLANCTTCHVQRDCLTCHSTTGWGINPHGPDFDAKRMVKSTAPTCLLCHVQLPATRRSP
jgi:hypothetical protein